MKNSGVGIIVGLLLVSLSVALAVAATAPPKHLKKVGDHWTAWDPPEAGPDSYIIQKGDNLWDLATKWYDDPFLWPQIWDENRYILDSHWIYPGDPLVVPGKPTVVPDSGPPVADNTGDGDGSETGDGDAVQAVGVTPAPMMPVASASELYCSGYIANEPDHAPTLFIAGLDGERQIMGDGDVFFLNQGRNHGVRAGDTLAIVRWTQTVNHPSTDEVLGTMVRRMGRARVLMAHENTATAVIDMSCEDIVKGDELVPWSTIASPALGALPPFDTVDPTPSGGPVGQIVYARDDLSVVGEGNVIYTDLGQQTGASPGDVLLLYRDREEGLPRLVLGQAVVLTVESETSTAKIMYSRRESLIGDRVEISR